MRTIRIAAWTIILACLLFALLALLAVSTVASAQTTTGVAPQPEAPAASVTVYARDHGVTSDSTRDQSRQIESAFTAMVRASSPEAPARLVVPAGVIGYIGVRLDLPREAAVGCVTIESEDAGGVVTYESVDDGTGIPRVVGRPGGTTFRVVDGWAANYAAGRAPPSRVHVYPAEDDGSRRAIQRVGNLSLVRALGEACIVFRGLAFDGNKEADDVFSRQPGAWQEENLRNGGAHVALAIGAEGGSYHCTEPPNAIALGGGRFVTQVSHTPGLRVYLRGLRIERYTAVSVLGSHCVRVSAEGIRVGPSHRNHVIYHADGGREDYSTVRGNLAEFGGWQTVTLVAGSWTEWITTFGLRVVALRVEPATGSNPFGMDPAEVFNVRSGRAEVFGLALDQPLGWAGEGGSRMPRNWSNGRTDRLDLPEWYAPPTRPVTPVAPVPETPTPTPPEPPGEPQPPTDPPPAEPEHPSVDSLLADLRAALETALTARASADTRAQAAEASRASALTRVQEAEAARLRATERALLAESRSAEMQLLIDVLALEVNLYESERDDLLERVRRAIAALTP